MTDTSDTAIEAMLPALIARDMAHEAAMLLTLQAERKAGWVVAVKPLEWVVSGLSVDYLTANTGLGSIYRISGHRGEGKVIWWLGSVAIGDNCNDITSAKAAAQADYSARILAALTPPTEARHG